MWDYDIGYLYQILYKKTFPIRFWWHKWMAIFEIARKYPDLWTANKELFELRYFQALNRRLSKSLTVSEK